MCQTIILVLTLIFFGLCDALFWLVLEWNIFWAAVMTIVLSVVFFVVAQVVWAAMAQKTKKNMKYSSCVDILTLTERKGDNALALEVQKYAPPSTIHKPTGDSSCSKTAHSSITDAVCQSWYERAAPADCYEVVYNCGDGNGFGPVKRIELTPELVEKAKQNSDIRPFLDEEKGELILLHKSRAGRCKDALENAKKGTNHILISLIEAADLANQQLDREECKAIHRWLCGKD